MVVGVPQRVLLRLDAMPSEPPVDHVARGSELMRSRPLAELAHSVSHLVVPTFGFGSVTEEQRCNEIVPHINYVA